MNRPLILLAVREVRTEPEVMQVRNFGRQLAALAGFDAMSRARLGAAISEIARNAVTHAGGGQVRFHLADRPPAMMVEFADQGPGMPQGDDNLHGATVATGGNGLVGTKRLMDEFTCTTGTGGTTIRFAKHLPPSSDVAALAGRIRGVIESLPQAEAQDEVRAQHAELLRTLHDLREREVELLHLNRELEVTNRGVVALYAELDQRAEQFRQASDLKSRFLSNISHEFRTPLNSIIALSRLLLDRADGPLSVEQERQVGFIRKGAVGLAEMVDDLLDLAKSEAGHLEATIEEFALSDMIDLLRGLLRPLLTSNPLVTLVFDPPPAIVLRTDERKLAQIVRNFIVNALRFTERGEVRVGCALVAGDRLSISVADTGIGISEDDQRRLFVDFMQVKGPLQQRSKGTGLGLALARRLADILGGTVAVASRVGEGSVFTVEIPCALGARASESPARRPVLLHIDDDETFRYLIRSRIGPDYVYLEADDGPTGLRLAHTNSPDAILLDLDLPGLDGYQFYRLLRGDPSTVSIPVVLMTSYACQPDDDRVRGCLALIDKNLTDDPVSAVKQVLQNAGIALRE